MKIYAVIDHGLQQGDGMARMREKIMTINAAKGQQRENLRRNAKAVEDNSHCLQGCGGSIAGSTVVSY